MNSERGEEILSEIMRTWQLNIGERERSLYKAEGLAALELVKRRQGEAPKLPFPSWELWEFLDWVEKEELLSRGGEFQTAWDIYKKKRDWDAGERV